MIQDLTVRVLRFYEDDKGQSMFGYFVSKVYAINECEFLVYDDGDYDNPGGFEWVNFLETYTDPWPDGDRKRAVELIKGGGDYE